jgi:hypothetical protein
MKRSELLLQEILEIKRTLIQFLRHPMTEMKSLPDWPWLRLAILHIGVTAITGALGGFAEHRIIWSIFVGLFISPILYLIILGISTLFFYYCFQIFAERTVSPRRLFTVILFANIPQFIFQIISGFVPPITLVGMAFTALLLLVGLVKNFQLNRKLVIRIISSLYALFFAIWMWDRIQSSRMEKSWNLDHQEAPAVELGK